MAAVLLGANGQPVDEEYDKALRACTMMLLGQASKARTLSLDETGHGSAYDTLEERCRKALGALLEN